ncbi:conserved hypothetical protein [Xenorhabdus bovienii str. oregonense]|uniref:Glycosyl transferase n=1 Tax=Xenorhabdus bovienii str. oregonense TaxID=1398202 RepID=A0A077P8X9_XENBV|nr:DUF1972 domain-containing protein [Xenorhabdus bovienii]CDH07088.1 conserved hypothetical protein [Xenorhabdus bovienii str. oregonense]
MKKVAIIGTVGLPACYGGFESLVENLTLHSSSNISYEVFCSSKHYAKKIKYHNNAKLIYSSLNANGIQSIPYDIFCLIKCLKTKPDITLILGVSGCVFLPIYKLFSSSKIITNIDGLEWKRKKWGFIAKKFLKFSEFLAVKYSDLTISDNQVIAKHVKHTYKKDSQVIAYGGDHVITKNDRTLEITNNNYYVALCRIEPENNVELILKAFSQTTHFLKFIGNWNSSEYGKKLKEAYGKYNNIEIIDPIYDLNILYTFRKNCKGYIHGHSAGGTNPSLVEAMHFEKPIFSFDCDFNRYSTENKSFYFSDSLELINLLNNTSKESIKICADSMKEIAMKKYRWDIITRMYEETYF